MNNKRSDNRDEILPLDIRRKALLKYLTDAQVANKKAEERTCLIIIDIRDFRELNHSFGERCGDAILQAIYKRLLNICGEGSRVFYLGNDEFGIAISTLQSAGLVVLNADAVLALFKQIFEWENHTLKITVNCGIAYNYEGHEDANQLLYDAELALKQAKFQNQPYQILGKKDRSQSDQLKWELLGSLHHAMNDGELSLYYQPKMPLPRETEQKEVEQEKFDHRQLRAGAEALIRWQNKTHGLISPATTLPLIEHLGSELELVRWLINTALKNLSEQNDARSVGINIPPTSITTTELYKLVKEALNLWPVNPQQLTLEITEDVLIQDKELAFDCLSKVRKLGVRIAIDDFGTGYSSLAYFKHIPADELKIDQTFIKRIKENIDDRKIVKLVIELAHSFDLEVVAEGVEDNETIKLLTDMGCDYVQGFAIAKPLPYKEYLQWIENQ